MQSLVEKAEEYYTRKEMNDLNETFEKKMNKWPLQKNK